MNENPRDLFPMPVRAGIATGSANERQMDARVTDNQSWNTVSRINPDGSTTRLKTRGGALEYVTTPPDVQPEVVLAYLESGAQGTLDSSDNPAIWNLLNLSPPKDFLGWIYAEGGTIGAHAKGELNTGNASAAMTTLARKEAALRIPASLFSGTMRLFIQAQYGAKDRNELLVDDRGTYGCSYDAIYNSTWAMGAYDEHITQVFKLDGSNTPEPNVGLIYKDQDTNTSINLGFTVNSSCGIFRTNNKYWVITIDRVGSTFYPKAYRILFPARVTGLLRKANAIRAVVPQTDDTRHAIRQCLAYAFAYGKVDVDNPVTLASFDGAYGYPLAYGWKWNTDGTEAKIILHQRIGTGNNDAYWKAHAVTVVFSYQDADAIQNEAQKFSVTAEVTTGNDHAWYNGDLTFIYAPPSETVDLDATHPMRLHRIALHDVPFRAPGFGYCKDLPIYGFYVNDEWFPLRYTRKDEHPTVPGFDPGIAVYELTQEVSNFYDYGSDQNNNGIIDYEEYSPTEQGVIIYPYTYTPPGWHTMVTHSSSQSASYDKTFVCAFGTHQELSFRGESVDTWQGSLASTRSVYDITATAGSGETTIWSLGQYGGIGTFGGGGTLGLLPSGVVAALEQLYGALAVEMAETNLAGYCISVIGPSLTTSVSYKYYERPAGEADPISVVIPHGDAEAAFLMKGDASELWTLVTWLTGEYPNTGVGDATIYVYRWPWDHVGGPEFTNEFRTSYGPAGPFLKNLGINYGYNLVAQNEQQVGGSTKTSSYLRNVGEPVTCPNKPDYEDFWKVENRFFDAGVFSLGGAGVKYQTSEGADSGDSLQYTDRFCGWV